MSTLKIYSPQSDDSIATETAAIETASSPDVLSFEQWAPRLRRQLQFDVLHRAKLVHENSACPHCRASRVIAVDSPNGLQFQCNHCDFEWSA